MTRKCVKEMILAGRIEKVADQARKSFELYLNEIPLGRRSFGVQARRGPISTRIFSILESAEMAFLAILPKAARTLWPQRPGNRPRSAG